MNKEEEIKKLEKDIYYLARNWRIRGYDPEDLEQELRIELWTKLDFYEGRNGSSVKSFALVVMKNHLGHLLSSTKTKARDFDVVPFTDGMEFVDEDFDLENFVDNQLLIEHSLEMVNTDKQRIGLLRFLLNERLNRTDKMNAQAAVRTIRKRIVSTDRGLSGSDNTDGQNVV